MIRYGKGSALLVVLGLMAFLSMSALAFAAYMRYSRASSSYTRRTSAARGLVKGAFTRAVDAIDKAVNDHPHPNLSGPAGVKGEDNIWLDRVYTGVASDGLVKEGDTVSPLSLEALSYIPPFLVNTMRWYSRRTPTAMWKTLDYDMGRYAYCALDISDYLDVNRLFADAPRSSAPHTRFTLSYLFDDDGSESYKNPVHTSPGKNTGDWDFWMTDFRNVKEETREISWNADKVPLISIADFNMALGKRGKIPPFLSPFYEFVGNNNLNAFDNTAYAEGGQTYADLRRMTLATDGLFPRHDTVPGHPDVKAHDLNDAKNQPYPMDYLTKPQGQKLSDAVEGRKLNSGFANDAGGYDKLSGLGCAALCDYLDANHVPLSLAIPTTERVPMICGIETVVPSRDKPFVILDKLEEPEVTFQAEDSSSRVVETVLNFRINPAFASAIGAGQIQVLTAFPFSHYDETDSHDFELDGRLSFFLADGTVLLRPVGVDDTDGRLNNVPHLADKAPQKTEFDTKGGLINVGFSSGKDRIVEDNPGRYPVKSEMDALNILRIPMGMDVHETLASAFEKPGNELLSVKIRWKQVKPQGSDKWSPSLDEVLADIRNGGVEYLNNVTEDGKTLGVQSAHCAMPAIEWKEKGICKGVVQEMSEDGKLKDFISNGGSRKLVLKGALWLRVLDNKNDKIAVDMVPACLKDDEVHLGVGSAGPGMANLANYIGGAYPLMLLETGLSLDFSVAGLLNAAESNSGGKFEVSPRTIYVSDPRYNHAPEHWFVAEGDLSKEGWLAQNRSWLGGKDADIFMSTSDSGYMQSKYELMFIPRLTNLKNAEYQLTGWYENGDVEMTSIPSSFEGTLNKLLVWKTYCPFPEVFPSDYLKGDGGNDDYAAFDALPWTNDGSSFMMTPYSDNLNAFSSVFANTPIDWKRATTNEPEEVQYCSLSAKEFNSKYAYNEWTSEGKLAWEDVQSIARRYMGLVRRDGELRGDWKQAWQDMEWFDGNDKLCGIELAKDGRFWSADKKFLYGFWRDCIDPKQQLYLVFVRAEPMMIGVGDLRKMPPQLGARAVGLVWRDPAPTKVNDGYPHRTRTLFYRQFD